MKRKTKKLLAFLPILVAVALALFVAFCSSSCIATSADLQRIADKQMEGEQRIAARLDDYEQGLASWEEVEAEIKGAWGETAREIGDTAADIKARAEGAAQLTWETILGTLLASAGVAGVGVNAYRNRSLPGSKRIHKES